MATRTENLKLSKAETSDSIKSTLIANNQNFDMLDGVITRLKNNQLQGTASGTEIELTDAGEVESVLHLSGNSEQDSEPSPDYPSEIRSVKSKSDNLFDLNMDSLNSIGATTEVYGNTIKVNATTTEQYKYTVFPIPNSEKLLGETITLSIMIKPSAQNKGFALLAQLSSGNSIVSDVVRMTQTDESVTATVPSEFATNATKLGLILYANRDGAAQIGDYVTYTNVMLNKGTEALPYQPYGYVPAEVKVEGKNKAKEILVSDNIRINNGVYTQNVADTKTNIEWKAQKRMNGKNVAQIKLWVDSSLGVKNVTFTKDDTFNRIYFGLNGSARDTLTYIETDNLENGEIYTLQWNVLNATQGSVAWNNVQIEKGSIATSYEPFKLTTVSLPLGDIELRSTPDGTRDTFARVDGVWNKVDYVKSFRYDGSDDEAWGNQSGGSDTENTAMFALSTALNANYANRISYCNRFKYYTNGSVQNSTDDVEGFNFNPAARYSNYIYFRIKKSLLPTQNIAGWKTWLKSNPIEVVLPTKTPTYTPITDQALISALDELEELILHQGYNYITATSVNGVKAQLDLSYYKDINIVLDNINATILSLGGGINV